MINRDANNIDIQALPIHSQSFVGVPTNQKASNMIVHANEDGDVVFGFIAGDVTVPMVAGQDISVAKDCTGVTSTASVIIS